MVGSDRVAANGDVANKIGTYGVAILAKEHGIPVYVACPWSNRGVVASMPAVTLSPLNSGLRAK